MAFWIYFLLTQAWIMFGLATRDPWVILLVLIFLVATCLEFYLSEVRHRRGWVTRD